MEPQPFPLELAMDLIFRWKAEPAEQGFISDRDRSKIHRYLQAVDEVMESMIVKNCQSQSKEAMDMAVSRLKHEFLHILERVTAAQDEDVNTRASSMVLSSVSSTSVSAGVEFDHHETSATILDAIDDLENIAQRMNSAGYLADFIDIYTGVRKSFLATHLRRVGIQKWSTSDTWGLVSDGYNMHIRAWTQASKVFYKIIFPKEYKLSTQIFDAPFGDISFSNTVKDAKVELMNFAEALVNTRRAPEKLFKLLDLHNQIADFSVPFLGLRFQIVVAVRETLSTFENAVIHEVSSVHEEDTGRIHPLTRYVMYYITLMVDYEDILSTSIVSNPPTSFGDLIIPDVKFAEHERQNPLALHLVLIVVVLRFKLEVKSKNFKDDASLRHLFMTNNLHYILQHVKSSPKLEAMIGEDYTKYLSEYYLKQASAGYEKSTCARMLHCLRDDEPQRLRKFLFSWMSVVTLRKRIKKFNTLFEGVRSTQSRWGVEDFQLREELRLSIVDKLVPAYKSFLERYNSHIVKRKDSCFNYFENTYVKYSAEELQALISKDFFAT
ncbi:hypothetical protein LguiA_027995 [Lonicera macranthoides]